MTLSDAEDGTMCVACSRTGDGAPGVSFGAACSFTGPIASRPVAERSGILIISTCAERHVSPGPRLHYAYSGGVSLCPFSSVSPHERTLAFCPRLVTPLPTLL